MLMHSCSCKILSVRPLPKSVFWLWLAASGPVYSLHSCAIYTTLSDSAAREVVCDCTLCRLFNELIENIYHWDELEDEEAFVSLLASYSQDRFLVCSLRQGASRCLCSNRQFYLCYVAFILCPAQPPVACNMGLCFLHNGPVQPLCSVGLNALAWHGSASVSA